MPESQGGWAPSPPAPKGPVSFDVETEACGMGAAHSPCAAPFSFLPLPRSTPRRRASVATAQRLEVLEAIGGGRRPFLRELVGLGSMAATHRRAGWLVKRRAKRTIAPSTAPIVPLAIIAPGAREIVPLGRRRVANSRIRCKGTPAHCRTTRPLDLRAMLKHSACGARGQRQLWEMCLVKGAPS